ncbi:RDD family protein [Pseudoclavibacter helvolus]
MGLLVMRRAHRGAADRLPGDVVEVPVEMTLGLLLVVAGLVALVLQGVFGVDVTEGWAWYPSTVVAFVLQAISLYAGGVTLGERAVLIRVREADAARTARFARRTSRLLLGIGGFTLLGLWQYGGFLQFLLGVAALVYAFRSEEHRGLGQWVAGSRPIAVERKEAAGGFRRP